MSWRVRWLACIACRRRDALTSSELVLYNLPIQGPVSAPPASGKNRKRAKSEGRIDRRARARYPIQCELEYRLLRTLDSRRPISINTGYTIDISSEGLLFYLREPIPLGTPVHAVQLILNWPVTLNDRIPLELHIRRRLVRSESDRAALRIVKHEFRLGSPNKPRS